MELFCERLRRLRLAKKLSREVVAIRLGVTYDAVGRWERADDSPSRDKIVPLARIFGVTTDYLLSGAEAPQLAAIYHAIRSGTSRERLLAMMRSDV